MENAATYFHADDAEGLAAKLREIGSASPPLTMAREPLAKSDEKVRRFARDFAVVLDRVIARSRLMDVA
jgi:hypothetical protein